MATSSNYFQRFANSPVGRPFMKGIAENYGFVMKDSMNQGFLGLRGRPIKYFGLAGTLGGKRAVAGALGRLGMRAFWPALAIYNMREAYQKGGLSSALYVGGKEAVQVGLTEVAFAGAKSVLSSTGIGIGALAIGAGVGGFAFGEASRNYGKRIRNIELGGEVIDRFGQIATIRQRSLMALQNSHLNGRMALGNEAMLLHQSRLR